MKRILALVTAVTTSFALASCADSDPETPAARITSEEEMAEDNFASYSEPSDIRLQLDSAGYRCEDWTDSTGDLDSGICHIEDRGVHAVSIFDDDSDVHNNLVVPFTFEAFPSAHSVILGQNWTFTCLDDLPVGDCQEIATALEGGRIARSTFENDFETPVIEKGSTFHYTCQHDEPCDFPTVIESVSVVDECAPGAELEGDNVLSGDTQLIEISGTLETIDWPSRLVLANPAAWFWMEDTDGSLTRLSDMRSCDSTEQSWTSHAFADSPDTRTTIFEIPADVDQFILQGLQESLVMID